MKPSKYSIIVSLISLAVILFISCGGINIYPASEDISIGKNLHKEIKNDPKHYPPLQNDKVQKYVQDIVNEIIKSPLIKYRGKFKYSVTIIDDDDVVNAFCTPGGYIYVYTGLMKFVDNEATLAAILAHEVAHAELRHTTQRMTKQYGIEFLADLAQKQTGSKYTDMAENLFSGVGLLYNSRENEYEADEYSFKYLQSTKWYPGAMNYFFDKAIAFIVKGEENKLDELMSTHPLSRDRIEKVTQLIKKADIPPPTEKNLRYRDYADFKHNYLP